MATQNDRVVDEKPKPLSTEEIERQLRIATDDLGRDLLCYWVEAKSATEAESNPFTRQQTHHKHGLLVLLQTASEASC